MKEDKTQAGQTVPLDSLVGEYFESKKELEIGLSVAYPKGRRVEFMRSSRQRVPSCGVVRGNFIDGHPNLIIKPTGTKKGKVCFISLNDVLTKPNVTGQPRRNKT